MTSVGVVIGTFGNRVLWSKEAQRAIDSVKAQTYKPADWIHVHASTLAEARNRGADMMDTEHLIFLDADDELDPYYIEWMLSAWYLDSSSQSIYRPSTLGVYEDGSTDDEPVMLPRTDLKKRNCIVIGAMCPAKLFFDVGGFGEWPILEDWALWRAMRAKGAAIRDVKEAVYRVHVRPQSRNTDQGLHGKVYRDIQKAVPL